MFPGSDGGMEWGGGGIDPSGVYYGNINEIPWGLQMVETRPGGLIVIAASTDHYFRTGRRASTPRK